MLTTLLCHFCFGVAAFWGITVQAACPDFLNTEMRKLASKERVNFCEAYEGKTAADREHGKQLRLYKTVRWP